MNLCESVVRDDPRESAESAATWIDPPRTGLDCCNSQAYRSHRRNETLKNVQGELSPAQSMSFVLAELWGQAITEGRLEP